MPSTEPQTLHLLSDFFFISANSSGDISDARRDAGVVAIIMRGSSPFEAASASYRLSWYRFLRVAACDVEKLG